jgi:hypothetical protein
MPKAILEFNLPEENEEYRLATQASKNYCALWDIQAELRNFRKEYVGGAEALERIEEIIASVEFE